MRFGYVRKLPSGRYQGSYLGPDGKRHNGPSTFTHKADAQAWITGERRLVEYGTWTSPAARAEALREVEQAEAERAAAEARAVEVLQNTPTVSEWIERCISERQSRSRRPIKQTTADNYRKLSQLNVTGTPLGGMRVTEVRRADVHEWRWDGPPSRTRTQGAKAYELLVSVFDDAVVAELIETTPCTLRGAGSPERSREPESLSMEEVDRFLAAIDLPWARAALTIQVTCGLRIGEVLALRAKDLDLEAAQSPSPGLWPRSASRGNARWWCRRPRPGHRFGRCRSCPTRCPICAGGDVHWASSSPLRCCSPTTSAGHSTTMCCDACRRRPQPASAARS